MNVGEVVIKADGSVIFEPAAAAHIAHVAQAVCSVADDLQKPVTFAFNGVRVTAQPGSKPADVAKDWQQRMELEQWTRDEGKP